MEKSQKILQKTKMLKSKIERFESITSQWEDLLTLSELGMEEQDESVIPEVGEGLEKLKHKLETLRLETLLTGPYDKNNAILTLHAGAGGTEAQDWVQMLLRMFTRWAEAKDYQVEILDYLDGDEAGVKSVTIQVIGENAYGYLKSEKGVHRLVRISPFDASGRRHTSFASLDVMPELDDSIEININPDDLRVDTYRASGAGGQHINKTSSAVRITHIPTGVVVSCQTQRSQFQNKDTAMTMLKSKLFDLKEREQKEKIEDLKGVQMDIAWGSQIRSYVFCPYTLVKDHRTNFEEGNVNAVMDGNLDGFINAYLSMDNKEDKNV
jgi:peptide chain release factor 2